MFLELFVRNDFVFVQRFFSPDYAVHVETLLDLMKQVGFVKVEQLSQEAFYQPSKKKNTDFFTQKLQNVSFSFSK